VENRERKQTKAVYRGKQNALRYSSTWSGSCEGEREREREESGGSGVPYIATEYQPTYRHSQAVLAWRY